MSLRIDRGSFLTLTFGMAGLACNTGPSPVVAANVVDIPQQPAQPPDAGAPLPAPKAEESASGPRAAAVPAEDDDDDPVDMESNAVEGSVRIVPLGNAGGCGFVDPKTVTRPAAACNEDQGTAGSCSVMKSCPGFAFPREKCDAYRKLLKPKVAQRAVDCLAKLSAKQVCNDACTVYKCGDLALKTSCPDPAADASCTQITTRCSAVSMSDCRMYLGGLNAAGRAKMVSCLTTKSGCGFGLYSCAEGLF